MHVKLKFAVGEGEGCGVTEVSDYACVHTSKPDWLESALYIAVATSVKGTV